MLQSSFKENPILQAVELHIFFFFLRGIQVSIKDLTLGFGKDIFLNSPQALSTLLCFFPIGFK